MTVRLILLALVLLLAAGCSASAEPTPQPSPPPVEKNVPLEARETRVPTPTATELAQRVHIVQPGESLWNIARTYGVDLDTLLKANPDIKDPSLIQHGQKIVMPGQ